MPPLRRRENLRRMFSKIFSTWANQRLFGEYLAAKCSLLSRVVGLATLARTPSSQYPSLRQVGRFKAFGEPARDRHQQLSGLVAFPSTYNRVRVCPTGWARFNVP